MANKPGRPPLDPTDRSVSVSLRLPTRAFDQLCHRAAQERVSVPELLRRALRNSANKDRETSER